ncbi:MAG: hypothetical protein CVV11_00210 [Gammaproteobacteria bacterium HGW-Gammaproteobacteria-15]|nr:MAG: hypothetical protein CVV11_00210 [Gammaproteobacteria bacterium HGW-Gammaproteobacteria-15]
MNMISVYSRHFSSGEISDSELEVLRASWAGILSIYEIYLQYSLVTTSLINFKKTMYSRAIDVSELDNSDLQKTSETFIDAENSVMYLSASLIKFVKILPALFSKCFLNEANVCGDTEGKITDLYNESNRVYMFVYELRNAIVHNRVSVSVRSGISRELIANESAMYIGYYLNLVKFAEQHVDTKTKRKRLLAATDMLADAQGDVDLVKVMSQLARRIYEHLVTPQKAALKIQLDSYNRISSDLLLRNRLLNAEDIEYVHVKLDEELLYSSEVLSRVYAISNLIYSPIKGTSITITPSVIK